jgi:hypothetical protein
MPSFESPLPYRPNRGTFWPESFFHLRVDELPVHDDSDADITAAAEASPVSTFKFAGFNQRSWDNGASSGYWRDSLPAGTSTAPDSPARRTYVANVPTGSMAGKHLWFSELRQGGATKVFGQYTILSIITQGDKPAVLWSENSRELVEMAVYRGDRPECRNIVTWDLDSYEMPLASNGTTPAGAGATRIPISPLQFVYQDLLDCGTTGNLGHMMGFVLAAAALHEEYVWPARSTDGAEPDGLREGSILRLKADFDVDGLATAPLRAMARTLQRHGMILYDRGAFPSITAVNDPSWPNNFADDVFDITDFERVDVSSVTPAAFTRNYPLDVPDESCRFGMLTSSVGTIESATGEPIAMSRHVLTSWNDRAQIATIVAANAAANRPTWISIPTPSYSQVTSGAHDSDINAILTTLRDSETCVWLSPAPNPEASAGQVSTGTAAQWQTMLARWITRKVALTAANVHIVPLISASNYTTGSGVTASSWLPASTDFPLIGVDYAPTSTSTGFNDQTWTAMTAALDAADKDFAISRLSRSTASARLATWDAAAYEGTFTGSRLKAICWDQNATPLSSNGLDQFLADQTDPDCYRGGVRRGITAGEVNSMKVTSGIATTNPSFIPQTLYRKIPSGWQTLRIRRKVNGVWKLYQLRRVGNPTATDLYTSTYQENY